MLKAKGTEIYFLVDSPVLKSISLDLLAPSVDTLNRKKLLKDSLCSLLRQNLFFITN